MSRTLKSRLFLLILSGLLLAPFIGRAAEPAFDVRPTPIKTPPPEYPFELKRTGVTGVVAVKVLIDEKGAVAECIVAKSTHPDFEKPALDAVKKWKFKPAQKAGEPVKAWLMIPLQFQLQD